MLDGIFKFLAAVLNAVAAKWKRDEVIKPRRESEIEEVQQAATKGDEQSVQQAFWNWRNSAGNHPRRDA